MRQARIDRETKETTISIELDLDGSGQVSASTGVGFFDHMLTAMGFHALIDLDVRCEGDLHVDQHHSVEDVGIAFGEALKQALGDYRGIRRYGLAVVPMDEALVRCALDLSGRAFARVEAGWRPEVGQVAFDFALVPEHFWAIARAAGITVHIDGLTGDNNHHICEAAFKAFGQALRQAVTIDPRRAGSVPSTKGSL